MDKEEFEEALGEADVDEYTVDVAGEAVSVWRDLDIHHDHEADVVGGTETIYLTREATGATYKRVGDIESSYGCWVDTNWNEWEQV